MPPLPADNPCTHDMGPGITVCLRCRQEQRRQVRSRQQRLAMGGGGATLGVVAVSMLFVSAFSGGDRPTGSSSSLSATTVAVVQQGEPEPASSTPLSGPVAPPSQPTAQLSAVANPVPGQPAVPSLPILVREGRSELADSIIVERAGDSIVVDFDTQNGRTRRRDKFERVVRETLPRVYGTDAASVLAAIPDGALLTGDLITELPERGLHLPLATGWTIDLWPQTRPGRDGPLVVGYRMKARRN